ncbi:MAG: OmpA family protein [Nitrosomonas sp.]|nr:MAG: OmpA family protein [Nitrosomonas sp.]HMU64871.1 OmpA family protein [Nitrosomonas sp.]HMV11353.1 OmpA family protein [Nitrosomonas sp.]HMW20158.1 OmpA family protein [Nitrosomonas sp.]HMW68228.1 OmpA family protein [Nitrosomonas sp.]
MKKIISAKLYLIGVSVLPLLMLSNMVAADAHNRQGESETEKTQGYNVNDRGAVSRNSTGLCWRTGFWTEEMAIPECDPDDTPPVEKQAATPAPAPLTSPEKITLSADALFDFDKAVLKPQGKASLDEFVGKLNMISYDLVIAVGHTDRLGSDEYNKRLSIRRAEAVKGYLVSKGISADRVFTDGKGESDPVTGDTCRGEKRTKALIDCLQPDRRVEIEVAGTRSDRYETIEQK